MREPPRATGAQADTRRHRRALERTLTAQARRKPAPRPANQDGSIVRTVLAKNSRKQDI
jgi:hypothetical protein